MLGEKGIILYKHSRCGVLEMYLSWGRKCTPEFILSASRHFYIHFKTRDYEENIIRLSTSIKIIIC
jgi:hypothetical protein